MYNEEVAVIQVYDHFSSTNDEIGDVCISEFVGIIEDETDRYFKLRHILADINNPSSAKEYHSILKANIVRMWNFTLTQEE